MSFPPANLPGRSAVGGNSTGMLPLGGMSTPLGGGIPVARCVVCMRIEMVLEDVVSGFVCGACLARRVDA